MGEIVATLPLPPGVEQVYIRPWGRLVLSHAVLQYLDEVARVLRAWTVPPDIRVWLNLRFHFADRRPRDLDHGLRMVLEAVSRALGIDDRHIDELRVYRSVDAANPRVGLRLMWDALPSHCAWCEPAPSAEATSGVCTYHKGALLAQRRERA